MPLTFESANDLALALRRAEAAHGEHEKETGQPDADWPIWYARFLEREQSARERVPEPRRPQPGDRAEAG